MVKDVTSPWKMNDRGTAWQKIKPGAAVRWRRVHPAHRCVKYENVVPTTCLFWTALQRAGTP